MDALCLDGSMTLRQWIDLAATLDVDGLEFYGGFLDLKEASGWPVYRRMLKDAGLAMPMLCCSPDFCHPDPAFRRKQIDREKHWIDMTAALGGQYCRVLSGQRRPEMSREEGLRVVVESIEACLGHAAAAGVTLILENHCKDNYWTYPEFAQHQEVFCELVARIDAPHFGVNYDPGTLFLVDLATTGPIRRSATRRSRRWGTLSTNGCQPMRLRPLPVNPARSTSSGKSPAPAWYSSGR